MTHSPNWHKHKCLVIGYGSIGQRHAKILADLGNEVRVVSRRPIAERNYATIADGLKWEPDYVVLATRTMERTKHLEALSGFQGKLLVEKPVLGGAIPLSRSVPSVTAVGYSLRFMQSPWLAKQRIGSAIQAHFHVGQALKEWRPGRVSADFNGVLSDLSHELDLALWIFGEAEVIGAQVTPRAASLLLCCERCHQVTITMNAVESPKRRWFRIVQEGRTFEADLTNRWELDDSYIHMHEAILSGGGEARLCTVEEGLKVVGLIDRIESATSVSFDPQVFVGGGVTYVNESA